MFDIGFSELAVIAVIGLIVLGPERLPVVARTLGRLIGRARGYVRTISSELEREIRIDEVRDEVRRAREEIEAETRSTVEPIKQAFDKDAIEYETADYVRGVHRDLMDPEETVDSETESEHAELPVESRTEAHDSKPATAQASSEHKDGRE